MQLIVSVFDISQFAFAGSVECFALKWGVFLVHLRFTKKTPHFSAQHSTSPAKLNWEMSHTEKSSCSSKITLKIWLRFSRHHKPVFGNPTSKNIHCRFFTQSYPIIYGSIYEFSSMNYSSLVVLYTAC